jgi:hypothetical protein
MPDMSLRSWRSALSRRQLLQAAVVMAATQVVPGRQLGASRGGGGGQVVAGLPCAESLGEILNLAATIEALAITFYYQAIQGDFFGRLPDDLGGYLRAALAQEQAHYNWLSGRGAVPHATAFYFPVDGFGRNGLPIFLEAMEELERASIALYLAATRRFAEAGEPVLAVIAGQMAGVEAEQRVLGREIGQDSPPAPNNLCFAPAEPNCVADVASALVRYLRDNSGSRGPVMMPGGAEIGAAIGDAVCEAIPLVSEASCQESIGDILNIAATAEALGITFYYEGIRSPFFGALSEARQWYLQAALDEEREHLKFLQANGATAAATSFFFPTRAFEELGSFLVVLDQLENVFIAAYLAAQQRFAQIGQPLLAQIAGQILTIEAEHRIMGRVLGGQLPPNNRCLVRADYGCLSEAATALEPFLQGGEDFTRRGSLPSEAEINEAVSSFGCQPVAVAENPVFQLYLPQLVR